MDTKSEKSKRTLLLRDFVADEDDRFIFSEGDHEIIFFSGNTSKPKRYIQVWYKEKDKRYLRDEAIMDWELLRYRPEIDERNERFWNRINKFYEDYFDGNNDNRGV
jgi:hypothetical protein